MARRLAATGSKRGESISDEEDDDDNDEFSRDYQRDRISGSLIKALTNANRNDELIAVYTHDEIVTIVILAGEMAANDSVSDRK